MNATMAWWYYYRPRKATQGGVKGTSEPIEEQPQEEGEEGGEDSGG